MAAYAAICSLTKTIEHLKAQPHISSSHLTIIKSFCQTIDSFRAFLDGRPTEATYASAQIREEANRAEDIIERHLASAADDGRTVNLQRLCLELQTVNEDMRSMAEVIKNPVRESVPGDSLLSFIIIDCTSDSRTQIEPSSKEKVFGFADEFYMLRRLIMGLSYAQYSLKVVPIVGRAGLGKTTLARKFYNDASTVKGFDILCWVTVSEDYSAKDVLQHLATAMEPYIREPRKRDETLEQYVHKNLKGKKFLIVLDDVWGMEVLEFLMRILPDNDNGGRILLTTRQERIAVESVPNQSMYLQMNLMSFEESYDLLLHKVFKHNPCPNELKHYIRLIALRSSGWPLVIVLLAGILKTLGESQHKWKIILDVLNNLDVDEEEDGYADKMFSSVMTLCYKCLPHRLRSCFLYMGAFPEDYEINVSRLAKKWLAEGLLSQGLSKEAEKYLHELVKRNLISVVKMKSNGEIKSCSLHDEVRAFCIKKAREEDFFQYVVKKQSAEETIFASRMMATSDLDSLERICSSCPEYTRTIVCFGRGRILPLLSIGRLTLLKVLDVINVEFKSFPEEIFQLFLLGLLALSHVPELPTSISNLRYLETLIIHQKEPSSSTSVTLPHQTILPFKIWTMQMLRHLVSFCFSALPDLVGENSAALTNLETLSAVMNLDCSEEMMRMIPNVKKLGIFYFGVERATHSIKNLEQLLKLEKLKIWVLTPFSSPQNIELGFPATIKKLNLRGIHLTSQDMITIGKLPNLRVLKLKQNSFEGDEWRLGSEEFSKLTYLLLQDLFLTNWASEDGGEILGRLEILTIRSCKQLLEIPKRIGEIPSLKMVEVVGGKISLADSAKAVVENQRKNGNSTIEDLIKKKN